MPMKKLCAEDLVSIMLIIADHYCFFPPSVLTLNKITCMVWTLHDTNDLTDEKQSSSHFEIQTHFMTILNGLMLILLMLMLFKASVRYFESTVCVMLIFLSASLQTFRLD